jgi:hypothetical protein
MEIKRVDEGFIQFHHEALLDPCIFKLLGLHLRRLQKIKGLET